MVGPLDPDPKAAASEAEAANRQNAKAGQDLADIHEAGHGVPGGEATHSAGGVGPTGATGATTAGSGGPTPEGRPASLDEGGQEEGMLGEGV